MITCVLPTRNEAVNLPHVVSSVQWCDEIIVVDMESTDGTPDVARSLGARVLAVREHPDFNMSRKVGLDAARNEWVLALDADEMVPKSLADALRELAWTGEYDVALMPRVNFKFGLQRGGSLWPDYQRRLYRKDAVDFVSAIHQYLKIKSERVKWLPVDDQFALHHFNYSPLGQQIDKLNKYTSTDATYAPYGCAAAPRWVPLRTFLSLHLKHKGWKEGIPGLWWSAHSAFYELTQRRKRLELLADGTVGATEKEIELLNIETTGIAQSRVQSGLRGYTVSLPSLVAKVFAGFNSAGSVDARTWRAARDAFRDLSIEMKVWESVVGRGMAERLQDETRAKLAAQWAGDIR